MEWPDSDDSTPDVGRAMHDFMRSLMPMARSITGDGLRWTLQRIGEVIPLTVHEVSSGTPVLDWTVPEEWNVHEAWIRGPDGKKVVDVSDHPLHLMGYSVPVDRKVQLRELAKHLHTLPEQPDLIPYRTSYYKRAWGFCLPHRLYEALPDGEYHVRIDSTLEQGSLTFGETILPGRSDEVVLFSCHVCHPGMANDNLSGMALAVAVGRALMEREERRFTYRLLFIPGTIGSIAWLASHDDVVGRIRHGLVLSGVGDPGDLTYKRSRRGTADVDRAVEHVLKQSRLPFEVRPFVPYGYDERQYCSPGFDLPVGCFMRTPWGEYPEYHTSGDDLDFVQPEKLGESFEALREVIDVLEGDRTFRSLNPKGEPQLGRRGLYRQAGGSGPPNRELALLWVLNLSDGHHTLLDIAERSELPFTAIEGAAEDLLKADLLEEMESPPQQKIPG